MKDKQTGFSPDWVDENTCVLQVISREECKEKFRTLPAHYFMVIDDSIKRVSPGNYLQ